MSKYLSSALLPGIIVGVICGVPVVNWLNCLCCAWLIVAVFWASAKFKKGNAKFGVGEGAALGAVTGIVLGAANAASGFVSQLIAGEWVTSLIYRFASYYDVQTPDLLNNQTMDMGFTILMLVLMVIIDIAICTLAGTVIGAIAKK